MPAGTKNFFLLYFPVNHLCRRKPPLTTPLPPFTADLRGRDAHSQDGRGTTRCPPPDTDYPPCEAYCVYRVRVDRKQLESVHQCKVLKVPLTQSFYVLNHGQV